MNTAHLKIFSPAVRRQLMEAVTRKLDFVLGAQTPAWADWLTNASCSRWRSFCSVRRRVSLTSVMVPMIPATQAE